MVNHSLYEYLSIVPPSASVALETREMKIQFKVNHGCDAAVKSKPHFTLSNIVQSKTTEEKLINNYKRLAASLSPFEIHFSGFQYFRTSNYTIYLSVQNEKPICEIVRHIKVFSKSILKTVKNYTPYYTSKPHLTIAKGISETDFDQIWPSWKNKEYNAVCTAERILLLKRPISDAWQKYEIIGDFLFTGNRSVNSQLKLF